MNNIHHASFKQYMHARTYLPINLFQLSPETFYRHLRLREVFSTTVEADGNLDRLISVCAISDWTISQEVGSSIVSLKTKFLMVDHPSYKRRAWGILETFSQMVQVQSGCPLDG